MTDCCQQKYGISSFDSMKIIKQMIDQNLETKIAKVVDDKYNVEEEMSYPRKIRGNRNPTMFSTGIEPEKEKTFGANILLDEYGRPKREAGRLVRMSLRSQKGTGIKRNLVRMAKRGNLVQMTKQDSPEQMAKRANIVRMTKRANIVRMAKRANIVRMAKRANIV